MLQISRGVKPSLEREVKSNGWSGPVGWNLWIRIATQSAVERMRRHVSAGAASRV